MFRYVLVFSKRGPIKYTSHLDMQRLFKRAFRRGEIDLAYSKGFNPHPKMGFAQPLSLGYEGDGEWMDFETDSVVTADSIFRDVASYLPAGISILKFGTPKKKESPAAALTAAEYKVYLPVGFEECGIHELLSSYMRQDTITTLKRSKKSKELKPVEIKDKIRSITGFGLEDKTSILKLLLDCGSKSNLSAESVISNFIEFSKLRCERYEIEVCRSKLIFPLDYTVDWV